MNASPETIDRIVMETIREAGGMTASEVAWEVGISIDAAERSLSRLAGAFKVREAFGVYSARQ